MADADLAAHLPGKSASKGGLRVIRRRLLQRLQRLRLGLEQRRRLGRSTQRLGARLGGTSLVYQRSPAWVPLPVQVARCSASHSIAQGTLDFLPGLPAQGNGGGTRSCLPDSGRAMRRAALASPEVKSRSSACWLSLSRVELPTVGLKPVATPMNG